ncbi:hypothetical protein B0T14DRAFT_500078 [Immersiella caudata]|uniref:Uncharacterized protein n=1 Tax=Immersiella caudata TaxID=314043 RepID=A0AA39T1C1_9PEZI|nr:hypothetical protein B0T14DRAFT_500078 [Immersiella caudata]
MHPILALTTLAGLATALPATGTTPTAALSPVIHPRGACQSRYTTHDYCHWFCSDCTRGGGRDWGCIQLICVEGCKAAIGYDNGGECKSHWNDGGTWAFKCTHGSDGTFGMSRWKMKEMGLNCWGGGGAAGEEFWCQC